MKGNLLWVWCLINTILIGLCFMTYGIDCNYDNIQDKRMTDMESRMASIEYFNEHKSPDTIVVNNYVKFFDKSLNK